MKRKIIIVLSVFLVCLMLTCVSIAGPAPEFVEAKKLSMSSPADKNGNYLIGRSTEKMAYMVGYIPGEQCVGGCMAVNGELGCVFYSEKDGTYFFQLVRASSGELVSEETVSEDNAVSFMRKVLEHITIQGISY